MFAQPERGFVAVVAQTAPLGNKQTRVGSKRVRARREEYNFFISFSGENSKRIVMYLRVGVREHLKGGG
jgi:hypothetical protein